jgi:predicted Zn-dependent protease
MELKIETMLQKAVEAHQGGKLQEAELLYRTILKAYPNHPDASHNLGVLAVSVNKPGAALALFESALKANPSQGQFWLSYIEALVKEKQFAKAKLVLIQAKKAGLKGVTLDELEANLFKCVSTNHHEKILRGRTQNLTQQK